MKFEYVDDKDIDDKDKEQSPKKKAKEKDKCPYCGELYISVNKHVPYCRDNPENQGESENRITALERKLEKLETQIAELQSSKPRKSVGPVNTYIKEHIDFLKSMRNLMLRRRMTTKDRMDRFSEIIDTLFLKSQLQSQEK